MWRVRWKTFNCQYIIGLNYEFNWCMNKSCDTNIADGVGIFALLMSLWPKPNLVTRTITDYAWIIHQAHSAHKTTIRNGAPHFMPTTCFHCDALVWYMIGHKVYCLPFRSWNGSRDEYQVHTNQMSSRNSYVVTSEQYFCQKLMSCFGFWMNIHK